MKEATIYRGSVTPSEEHILEAREVDFSYYDGLVIKSVSLGLRKGDIVGLIGPNGSGKTTLLRILSGFLPPKSGSVCLSGRDLGEMSRRDIASLIAVVPQELEMLFSFSVWEMVMMGRTPHVGRLLGAGRRDREVVERVMERVGIQYLAGRPFQELSGGERQKVIVAMGLAQEPAILLLDEPTVHLDINHQVEVLELLRRFNSESGLTVLATMHDLNLAALYFDNLVLLNEGEIVSQGTPEEVLQEANIRRVFEASVEIQKHPTLGVPHMVILPPPR